MIFICNLLTIEAFTLRLRGSQMKRKQLKSSKYTRIIYFAVLFVMLITIGATVFAIVFNEHTGGSIVVAQPEGADCDGELAQTCADFAAEINRQREEAAAARKRQCIADRNRCVGLNPPETRDYCYLIQCG